MASFNTQSSAWISPDDVPIRIVDLEVGGLGRPPSARPAAGRAPTPGWLSGRVLALVRAGARPIGTVLAQIDDAPDPVGMLADMARRQLAGICVDAPPEPARRGAAACGDAPSISVVVPTRERPHDLARCLESITALPYERFETIVVDNDPRTDATRRLVRDRFAGAVRYIREPVRGASAARNRGAASASGQIIAFADDDVVVDRHWLDAVAAGFASGDGVGCVTGPVLPAELDTPAQAMFEAHGGFPKGFAPRRFQMGRPAADRLFPFTSGRFGAGANMAFTAEALRRVGGFDRAIGPGTPARAGEDLLAFFQTIVAGYAIVYEPDALAWHYHRRTQQELAIQARGYGSGLTAYLTAALVHEPQALPMLLGRLPSALAYAVRRYRSAYANDADGSSGVDWPRRMSALERRGLVYGPIAYARGRRPASALIKR